MEHPDHSLKVQLTVLAEVHQQLVPIIQQAIKTGDNLQRAKSGASETIKSISNTLDFIERAEDELKKTKNINTIVFHLKGELAALKNFHDAASLAKQLPEGIDVASTLVLKHILNTQTCINKDGFFLSEPVQISKQAELIRSMSNSTEPVIAIAWDTDTVDPDDYTELVAALNQFVQEHGAAGLKLIKSDTIGVNCESGVPA